MFRPGVWLRKQDKACADGELTGQQSELLDALPTVTSDLVTYGG
ncbi:hypothetical protein ACIGXM_15555 [Kitasatospora sp. NPDC052896]